MKINLYRREHRGEVWQKDAIQEYIKRISRFSEVKLLDLKRLKGTPDIIFLTGPLNSRKAEMATSVDLSESLRNLMNEKSSIDVVIQDSADFKEKSMDDPSSINSICLVTVSLSTGTECVLLLEQIYRAFKIMNNETYHK